MPNGRRATLILFLVVLGFTTAISGTAGRSQMPSQSTTPIGGGGQHQAAGGMNPDLDSQTSPFRDSARQRLNTDRQRKLVNDTERLLALANELKAEAAVAGTESLTPQMLRQMDEIEKLARSVKDKMRS